MIPNFNSIVLPKLKEFNKISINYSHLNRINECVLNLLQVSDFGKLNDKYDGQLFYEKFKTQTFAEIAVEKVLKKEFINWSQKKSLITYRPILQHDGLNISIVGAKFGEFPLLTPELESNIIACFVADKSTVWVSGIIDTSIEETVFIQPSQFLKHLGYKGHLASYENMQTLINS